MQGVKGLLQQAGFTVYNPTLPYHSPQMPGILRIQVAARHMSTPSRR